MINSKETNVISREDAYNYIYTQKCGTQQTLQARIGNELFDELCLIGYIKQGMDGSWNERWEITCFGESQIKAYLNFSEKNRELDKLLN